MEILRQAWAVGVAWRGVAWRDRGGERGQSTTTLLYYNYSDRFPHYQTSTTRHTHTVQGEGEGECIMATVLNALYPAW